MKKRAILADDASLGKLVPQKEGMPGLMKLMQDDEFLVWCRQQIELLPSARCASHEHHT